jgi:hypothetical protein
VPLPAPCASPPHRCVHWYNPSPPAAQISAVGLPPVSEFRRLPSAHPATRLKSTRIDRQRQNAATTTNLPAVVLPCQYSTKSNPMSRQDTRPRTTRQSIARNETNSGAPNHEPDRGPSNGIRRVKKRMEGKATRTDNRRSLELFPIYA